MHHYLGNGRYFRSSMRTFITTHNNKAYHAKAFFMSAKLAENNFHEVSRSSLSNLLIRHRGSVFLFSSAIRRRPLSVMVLFNPNLIALFLFGGTTLMEEHKRNFMSSPARPSARENCPGNSYYGQRTRVHHLQEYTFTLYYISYTAHRIETRKCFYENFILH